MAHRYDTDTAGDEDMGELIDTGTEATTTRWMLPFVAANM